MNKTMKNMFAVSASAILMFAGAGTNTPEKEEVKAEPAETAAAAGAWTPAEDGTITDEETNVLQYFIEENFREAVDCVLVDEAQFLTREDVLVLCDVCDKLDKDVFCFGLKTDTTGNLFEGSRYLLALADVINEIQTPVTFTVNLERRYCGNIHADTVIPITVTNIAGITPMIAGPDTVCIHTNATYTGSGGNPSTYRWSIEGSHYNGTSATHSFDREGNVTVTLSSSPYT